MIRALAKGFILWVKRLFVTQAVIGVFTGNLSESGDLTTAVNQYIRNFQTENHVKIISYTVTDNFEKDQHHGFSGVARMKFEYEMDRKKDLRQVRKKESGQVILKVPSLAPLYPLILMMDRSLFDREIFVYEKILPELYRLGQCKPFAPILYTVTKEKVLVLEDLSVDKFIPRDHTDWLDLNECRITLEVLARYHALGYKYLQSLSKNDPSRSLISLGPLVRESIQTIDEFYEIIKPHLSQQLQQKIIQLKEELQNTNISKLIHPRENSMLVLIHGDFRTGNILFKYDNNDLICEVKILDWQLTREASPVLELMFFFLNSISIETIKTHVNDLLNFYLEKLNNELISLNIDRSYSKAELDADMIYYKYRYFDLVCGIFERMINLAEPGTKRDSYIFSAVKWLNYLNENEII